MFIISLKQVFRGLWRYKAFTVINLLGLSVGVAAVLLIFMIADYEKRFDEFHAAGDDIFRVVSKAGRAGKELYEAAVPYPTARLLRNEHPGIVTTEIHFSGDANVRIGNQSPFAEKNVVFADSGFFKVFDFAGVPGFIVAGDPVSALKAPGKAVLTESTAKRYFGNANPLEQVLKLDTKLEVEVAAIVKDVPPATHLPINMLVSYASLTREYIGGFNLDSWSLRSNGFCYVKLDEKTSVKSVESALYSIVQKNGETERDKKQSFYLQPLAAVHFDPAFEANNPTYTVSPKYLDMLLLLGVFIILIACVNYINLSTSLAFSKSKEVGIRKTIGASRLQLFFFYMSETLALTTIAMCAGFCIAFLGLPYVNGLLDKQMSFGQLVNPRFVSGAVIALFLTSFVSGVYPALILSGFKPIESLKSRLPMPGKSSTLLRRGLVVFQFTTSIALIICTIVIAKQMNYFNSKSLGFNKEAVVEVALPSPDSTRNTTFINMLRNQAGIVNASLCLGAPISENGISTTLKAPELSDKTDYSVKLLACDRNYLATYGIRLVAGRWFFEGEEKNRGSGIVVNKTLAETLGYSNPADAVGKKIFIGINDYTPVIIGVAQDFHTTSLHKAIMPTAMMPFSYFYYAAGIRIEPGSVKGTLATIESVFKKVYPEYVYQVSFIDETLGRLYEEEERNYNLFKAFSVISIFICCIGLWGLVAFVVVRKTREIGIRKVLGATVSDIVALLSKDFLRLVLIALVVASPIAWYFMHQWLENYAYRIDISWWVFAVAGFFAVAIALATISFQAVKAAIANPVKNLRTE